MKMDITYKPDAAYRAPTARDLDELTTLHPGLDEHDANDPTSTYDNRSIVRIVLWPRYKVGKLSKELYESLLEPYDNGFYKKADGKSAPFGFLKVLGVEKKYGVQKDITSVRHDLDYYMGVLSRKEADQNYYKGQIGLDHNKFWARVEYYALRMFGRLAWSRHRRRQDFIIRYGQIDFIDELRDTELKKKK